MSYSYLACIEALQAAASSLGHTPTTAYAYERWRGCQEVPTDFPNAQRVQITLGAWRLALQAAGLVSLRRSKNEHPHRGTRDEEQGRHPLITIGDVA